MNKINWELKIDGKFKKDYDLDEIDYIADKIREGQFSGEINVDLNNEACKYADEIKVIKLLCSWRRDGYNG